MDILNLTIAFFVIVLCLVCIIGGAIASFYIAKARMDFMRGVLIPPPLPKFTFPEINYELGIHVFIVGQYRSGEWPNIIWDLQGIFEDEDDAIAACKDQNYFYCSMILNQELSREQVRLNTIYPING